MSAHHGAETNQRNRHDDASSQESFTIIRDLKDESKLSLFASLVLEFEKGFANSINSSGVKKDNNCVPRALVRRSTALWWLNKGAHSLWSLINNR